MKQMFPVFVPVLWLLSFFFSLPLVEPYEISRLLALGAAVAALGVVLADPQSRAVSMTVTPLVLLVTGFLVWCGLTFFWSLAPFITIIAWGTLCLLPLWFLIFALMPVTRDRLMLTLRLGIYAVAALALWALVQYFLLPQFLNVNGNIRYPFADPNNYAGLLNMGLFMALGLSFYTNQKRERLLMMACCVLMMAATVLIGSRMAMINTVFCLAVFMLFARKSDGFNLKIIGGVLAAGILALLVSGLFGTERLSSLERVGEMFAGMDDKSVSTRFMIWSSTGALIQQYFWMGSGLGTFFLMYPGVRDAAEIYSSGLMTHADPLQFWAEAGLPAIVLLYAILIAVMAGTIRYLCVSGTDRMLIVGIFCGLLTLALHLHVTFHLFVPSLLALAGLMMGALVRFLPQGKALVTCRAHTPAMTGLLLMIAFLVIFQSCLFSEMHTRQGVEAMNRNDMQTFSLKINQAGREGFGLNPRPYVLAASIPLGILQTTRSTPEERARLFRQTDALLDEALAVSPVDAGASFSKALLYGAMGRADEAHGFLEQTLKIDPRHPQARAMMGR